MTDNVYKEYEEKRRIYFSACDGFVKNASDAEKAVIFFKIFYKKLKCQKEISERTKKSFERTIKKYKKLY